MCPIRLPETIRVQERLPPGAAAVLINRAHTDTDLFLPIDEEQGRWFEAIDGRKTAGAILERVVDGGRQPPDRTTPAASSSSSGATIRW